MKKSLCKTSFRTPLAAFCLTIAILASSLGLSSTAEAKQQAFTDVPPSHWAYDTIMWSKEQGISEGYVDGTFRPTQAVTESELLAMLVRAYPEINLPSASTTQKWYSPYYELAYSANWPIHGQADLRVTRGDVAEILAAVLGQSLNQRDAIQYLIDKGIAQGKNGAATVEGYDASSSLSRAEAQTFLYRLKQHQPAIQITATSAPAIQLLGIQLGDSEAKVIQQLGQPDRKDATPSSMVWYIYNKDYSKYAQIGIEAGVVTAMYSSGSNWTYGSTQGLASIAAQANTLWGSEISSAKYVKNYQPKGYYVSLYIDSLNSNEPAGLLVKRSNARVNNRSISDQVKSGYEKQLFDLANVFRAENGLNTLSWNEQAAAAAAKHSQDMAKRNFFDHTNPDGKTPADRLADNGAGAYRTLGENISAGYSTPIDAHFGWVNSQGHRNNLLNANFTTLGAGVASGLSSSNYDIYYTQNFFTPRS